MPEANAQGIKGAQAVRPDPARVRNGMNKSVYISVAAEGLVAQAGKRFRRSDSAILSLLAERYLPRMLADKQARL
jgi:hypothetical protein